jgi:hypothetical protein
MFKTYRSFSFQAGTTASGIKVRFCVLGIISGITSHVLPILGEGSCGKYIFGVLKDARIGVNAPPRKQPIPSKTAHAPNQNAPSKGLFANQV